ncbi:MAG: bifunctional phosphoglucose/phosphomannose isomerase [Candidatus Omnitrophica bacterium]|nr:bifunctional phosphoglucose/phosphomannose isomerase [Candidatus Omnitrophota bacterium]MDD5653184.1 bifunctional phosphoglucose/phosphomannose isomerase [Candidatus Omnitrophota bacterium]
MKNSLSLVNIKKIDKSGMLAVLLDFPKQCQDAFAIGQRVDCSLLKKDFQKIVFVGVGGSAIGADLVRSYLYYQSNLPITVVREYNLPGFVDSRTLVFISSYSGNTEESLNAYSEAKVKNASIVLISSGGQLKERAQADNFTFIQVPAGLPPRYALGFLSIIPLCVLEKLGVGRGSEAAVFNTVNALEELKLKNLNQKIAAQDNIAKFAAQKLYNKFPVVYSASINFDAVATRLRSQLNENTKCLALSGYFPEMNHNEIMAWQFPKKVIKGVSVVMFKDQGIEARVKQRMEITKEILRSQGVEVLDIVSRGTDLLSRIFSLAYIGDFISFYLAILYGVDPAPTDKIDYLKKKIKEFSAN